MVRPTFVAAVPLFLFVLLHTTIALPRNRNTTILPPSNNLTPFPAHTEGDFTIIGSVESTIHLGGYFAEYVFVAFYDCLAHKPRGLRIRSAGHIQYVSNKFEVRAEGTWLQRPSPIYGDVWDAVNALFQWSKTEGTVLYRHPIDVVVAKGEQEIVRVVLTLEHGDPLPIDSGGRLMLDGTVYPARELPGGEKVVNNVFGKALKRFKTPSRTVGQHIDYRWGKDEVELFMYFEIKPRWEEYAYTFAEVTALLNGVQSWYTESGKWTETCGTIQDKTKENENVGRWHLGIKPYDIPVGDSAGLGGNVSAISVL